MLCWTGLTQARLDELRGQSAGVSTKALGVTRPNPLKRLAHPTRFERVTFAFGGHWPQLGHVCAKLRSNQNIFESNILPIQTFAIRFVFACSEMVASWSLIGKHEEFGQNMGRALYRANNDISTSPDLFNRQSGVEVRVSFTVVTKTLTRSARPLDASGQARELSYA
jgi:hypothetical protein